MTSGMRLWFGVVSLLVCLATVAWCRPGLLPRPGTAPRQPADPGQQCLSEKEREARTAQFLGLVRQRTLAKRTLARRLLDHQITLFEAAAWFLYLNENPPECRDGYREAFPGNTDEEKVCRQVITWVLVEARDGGAESRGEMEFEHLECLLLEHLAVHGRVVLPQLW